MRRQLHHDPEPHRSLVVADMPSLDRDDAVEKKKTARRARFGVSKTLVFVVVCVSTVTYWGTTTRRPDSSFYWINHNKQQQRGNRDLSMISANHQPPLLVSFSDTPTAQECSIAHFDVSIQQDVGSKEPVLLSGWNIPGFMASAETFLQENARTAFYIKDSMVQISSSKCVLSFAALWKHISESKERHIAPMAFSNDQENNIWFSHLPKYDIPRAVEHISGFSVFSALQKGQSHSFHKHGESWIAAAAGYKAWWFLPPNTPNPPTRVNACDYLTGKAQPPPGATSCVQSPGTIIWFPKDYYHATCALSDWTVGIGKQQGPLIRQKFPTLPEKVNAVDESDEQQVTKILQECVPSYSSPTMTSENDKDWKWYNGNLTRYYNDLEKDHKRNPGDVSKYAVHRWMGEKRSTLVHYQLIHDAITRYNNNKGMSRQQKVLDAGCGLGSALMWMEQREPLLALRGHTISDQQLEFIEQKLPKHNFQVKLQSYDDLDDTYDAIYSIEALIHSPDIAKTLSEWAKHLVKDGSIVVIDDFLSPGVDKNDPNVKYFCKSWLANSLVTTVELNGIARKVGLELVESRDLLAEYRVVELNYRNSIPRMDPDQNKNHQGWMGSKMRQKLTVEGKLGYNMLVFRKKEGLSAANDEKCLSVPPSSAASPATFPRIVPKDECLSGWYCCNQGVEYLKQLNDERTHNYAYLKLDEKLFGNYMEVFATYLNKFYETLPNGYAGKFLDVGATGSTSSGMTQVTTKFQHFAGPLEYWMLDSDTGAKTLNRTLYCDVCDCPEAPTCGFDVTFSHTVLEHASHPDKAFSTVSRITKQGGLTLHLVPWSYQYHATPDDYYRFSHSALKVLLEDRGFEVLDVGYDLCSKPVGSEKNKDEHFDFIWLAYVVGRKK